MSVCNSHTNTVQRANHSPESNESVICHTLNLAVKFQYVCVLAGSPL